MKAILWIAMPLELVAMDIHLYPEILVPVPKSPLIMHNTVTFGLSNVERRGDLRHTTRWSIFIDPCLVERGEPRFVGGGW